MRNFALLLFVFGFALPAFSAKRITVEQLERALATGHGKPDVEIARQLSDLQLTERLSAAKLSQWKADSYGPETRQTLVALADASLFLDPPTSEIPVTPPPEFAEQRRIMARTIAYVAKTIPMLPNF